MTYEEAKYILHPDTSREALAEIDYYAGFNRDKAIETVNEACIKVCEAIDKLGKLQTLLHDYYSGLGSLDETISDKACRNCPHRDENGKCSAIDDCLLSDEETITLFMELL